MDLDLSTRQLHDLAVVCVGGEVDLETANQLGEHALAALRDVSPRLVLDLSAVDFMDSTGLKVLMTIQRRAELAGGSFAVAGAPRVVRRLLAVTGLDQSIPVHDTVDDAAGGSQPDPLTSGAEPTS